MAVFSKHDSEKSTESLGKGATIIAAGTKIKGDVILSSSLHIDGEIEGTIHSDNIVTIGTKGTVNGEVNAKSFVINGTFEGSAESTVIEILHKGKVRGKLVYDELTIEKGGSFEGETKLMSSLKEAEHKVSKISNHKPSGHNESKDNVAANL